MIQDGRFRSDLFYRLNVYPVHIPPLRARNEDIPDMVWAFVKEFSKSMDRSIKHISEKDMELAINYHWPGNIRELKNVVENAMISNKGETLHIQPTENTQIAAREALSFEDAEKDHIITVLKKTGGRIKGLGGAAEILMLKPSTLYSKMKRHGISPDMS